MNFFSRAEAPQDEAYAQLDRKTGWFMASVTLPSVTTGAFDPNMVYDQGATHVVICHADLAKMGISQRNLTFDLRGDTGGGSACYAPLVLPMMGVGRIRLNQVRALVPQQDHFGASLLGETALCMFSGIDRRGDTVIFRR